jgi:hypothetical protein
MDLGPDRRSGLDGTGDREGEESGGRAEHDAWDDWAAAVKGARGRENGMHWCESPK